LPPSNSADSGGCEENLEDGKYKNDVEAEADFRQLVDRDEGCK